MKSSKTQILGSFDFFGQAFNLKMSGKDKTSSCLGIFFSLLTYVTMISYTASRILVLQRNLYSRHQTYTEMDALNRTRVFTQEDLKFDVAFTIFASDAESIEQIEEVFEMVGRRRVTNLTHSGSYEFSMKKCEEDHPKYDQIENVLK